MTIFHTALPLHRCISSFPGVQSSVLNPIDLSNSTSSSPFPPLASECASGLIDLPEMREKRSNHFAAFPTVKKSSLGPSGVGLTSVRAQHEPI